MEFESDVTGELPEDDNSGEQPQSKQDAAQPWGEEFDAARAWNTIQKLRGYERQAKKLEGELQRLQAAEREREQAKLSEVERLQQQYADLQAQYEQERQQRAEDNMRRQIVAAAARASMHDPEDAWRHLDLGQLEMDDEGRISNVDALLGELAKHRGYLFRGKQPKVAPTSPTGAPQPTSDELLRRELFGGGPPALWQGGGYIINKDD